MLVRADFRESAQNPPATGLTQSGGQWRQTAVARHTREGQSMLRTFTAASMLALACALPVHEAAAQDPIAGGILGGVAGGLLGGAIGGRGGAVAGAIIGGTTGAAIAAQGQRRANGYYWYNNGCYSQRPDGA